MQALVLVVVATLSVSALCSLLEATLYSTRVAALEAAKAEGRRSSSARLFLELKRDIATPTSAILILNTIANTAGATLAGWLAARTFGAGYVPAFSAAFTLAILFLSEILPKTYGATNWKVLWPLVTWPLGLLVRALRPAVWVTRWFSRLFTADAGVPGVTEDEIRASIKMGARSGEVTPGELEMLDAVFHFDDTSVRQIMVPRDEVVYCDLDSPPAELSDLLRKSPYTRFPVCRGGLDNVVGMLHVRDLAAVVLGDAFDLGPLVRDVLRVPETLVLGRLLRQMQTNRKHLAVAIDEHGTVTGIVTLTEVLEQLVGSLGDELEGGEAVPPISRQPDNVFNVRGNVALARVNRELGLDLYDPSIVTLSGLMVSKLGRLLRKGDSVEFEGATAQVVEARANRATKIRLELLRPPAGRSTPEDAVVTDDESPT